MRNLLLIFAFLVSSVCVSAQKVYFVYLQSDNSSPFYVKMNDKIYSSATSGYLILSNLVDSTYNFSVGFPSSQYEAKFVISLDGKDRGFLVKNFDSGLGLFDLQNLTITNAQKDESAKNISYVHRNDDFSSLLSRAAKDTTLLYAVVKTKEDDVTVKKEEPIKSEPKQVTVETAAPKDTNSVSVTQNDIASEMKKPDSVSVRPLNSEIKSDNQNVSSVSKEETNKATRAIVQKDESKQTVDSTAGANTFIIKDTSAFVQKDPPRQTVDSTASTSVVTAEKKSDTIADLQTDTQAVFKRSKIKKHSESSTSEGFGLVYYDNYDGEQDTIRLLIPNPPVIFKQPDQDVTNNQKDFIHTEDLKKETVQQTPVVHQVTNNSLEKSPCKAIASTNDFFKLRKNMASENTDEDMVGEAKKFFKSKCFSTEQIKNLSALFLTSAGKYQFFDAAYLHVSDQVNFSSLQSEIKDDYYFKRFKALIGE